MRTLVVSSFPLVDAFEYKEAVLQGLVDRGVETRLLYSGVSPRDYFREARRRGPVAELRARLTRRRTPLPAGRRGSQRRLNAVARSLGIATTSFRSLAEPACLAYVRSYQPDLVHNLSALYVPEPFLEAARWRVVGGHYGDLPRIRGLDTIRWSVLLDHPLVVSHLLLVAELDMGAIVAKTPVEVRRGDDVSALRRRCQAANAVGHLEVVDQAGNGEIESIAQGRMDGNTFSRMGSFLRARVDEILRDERYSHYERSASAA